MLTDKELDRKLRVFNQRKLGNGEVFLLAKAIADSLPLPPQDTDNITIHNLSHKRKIDNVLYTLCEYSFVGNETMQAIYKLINELTVWRFKIAYTPPALHFQGEVDTVIDDISCLLRYVDKCHMCSVADIAETANYTYRLFSDLVSHCKSGSSGGDGVAIS